MDNREECEKIPGRWLQFNDSVANAAKQTFVTYARQEALQTMGEMLDMMNEKKSEKWKSVNIEEGNRKYRSLNNQLHQATDRATEQWRDEQCEEFEQIGRSGKTDLLYRQESCAIEKMTAQCAPCMGALRIFGTP